MTVDQIAAGIKCINEESELVYKSFQITSNKNNGADDHMTQAKTDNKRMLNGEVLQGFAVNKISAPTGHIKMIYRIIWQV